jgi:hydroxymethylglutaryl-CoA synthase
MTEKARPKHIGILAAEFYSPMHYVQQKELEEYCQVPKGKYTEGLMQDMMAFCMENEDVNSICLTAVDNLLRNHGIDIASIGRIEVGSESHIDRAKGIKCFLMRLFNNCHDISGSDHISACFGGTSALFSALNWFESSMWDGRYCLVVAGDIAVYDEGPARATGGAGAVALLIGPNAKITINTNFPPSFHSADIYDFFKGNMASEFPCVDGHLSVQSYLDTLVHCYNRFDYRSNIDYLVLHMPYSKLAFKAARLLESIDPKRIDHSMVYPSLLLTKRVGNMYCASIFAGLLSILLSEKISTQKNVLVFSYGSGSMGAIFSITLYPGANSIIHSAHLLELLDSRTKVTPENYTAAIKSRTKTFLEKAWSPSKTLTKTKGVWYLANVDECHRRFYSKYQ